MTILKIPVCPNCGAIAVKTMSINCSWDHEAQRFEDAGAAAESGMHDSYGCMDCDWESRTAPAWYTAMVPSQ